MLGVLKVPSGQEVDRLFRDVTTQITPADKTKVKLDVGKGQDGTAIHQMTAEASSLDPNLVKHCGDAGFFVAFPENAVLISFGELGLKSIQGAIETLAARKGGREEPLALQTHLSTLVDLSTDQDREAAHRAASETFKGAQAGKDRMALTINGDGRSLRLRLGLDVPALKFVVLMGQRGQAK
jgi:hypothetical protein